MKKITAILCLLLSINAFSQSDFRKGFIINKHGEKISGFVNYKENKTIYEYCEFKNTLNGNVIKYSPEKISAYGYDNIKEFIAKPLNNKNVFLEVIIKGKASLFKHLKKFYLELDNVFKELENEIVEYQNDDLVRYKRKSNRYKGILKVFFKDCPKVNSKINNVAYLEKSLSKIVVDFNTCKGEESIVIKNKVNKIEVLFGASIGFWVIIVRTWGGYPDAVAFAVVLMNMAVPLIDYYTKPITYGHKIKAKNTSSRGNH